MEQKIRKIRWGIMGAGRIAHKFCGMLKDLPEAELYAIGSRNLQKAMDFAGEYKAKKSYGSYEELVSDTEVEIIYVATPIALHYEHVKLCLQAGKHVLCEKTFTMDVAEAEELYTLAKEKGCFLMEALWSKFQPVFRKLVEWKETGAFGTIQSVDVNFYSQGKRDHRLYVYPEHGGSLYDLTLYPLTYACAMLGTVPKQVHAYAAKNEKGLDTMESIQLLYENGSVAHVSGGLAPRRRADLYIHGTKGRVLIDTESFFQAQSVELIDWDNEVVERLEAPFEYNGYEYEAREAMRCICERKVESTMHSMQDVIDMIRLLETCKDKMGLLYGGRHLRHSAIKQVV